MEEQLKCFNKNLVWCASSLFTSICHYFIYSRSEKTSHIHFTKAINCIRYVLITDRAESVPPFYSQITQVCVVCSLDVSTCLPLYEEEETIESLSAAEEEEEENSEAAATAAALEEEEEEEQWSGEEPEQEPPTELLERAEVIGEAQALPGLQAEVHTQAATVANEAPNGEAEEAGGQESPAEGVSILLTTCMFLSPITKKKAKRKHCESFLRECGRMAQISPLSADAARQHRLDGDQLLWPELCVCLSLSFLIS